ncbi:hypothetical protein CcCBS67573_g05700 [Chytriomyces confervae]|uniref:RNA helicase n=1 Tax=Chytriomyces confervae TaxID=246404 RepID=A0A507FBR6_9FUNG|nr:hypothetical protein HDU80_006495 [Chytriomyces hyalinus]TPX73030.1 hypothetical protein CcCBS67573_g05700 [Chytriomyces confervae]
MQRLSRAPAFASAQAVCPRAIISAKHFQRHRSAKSGSKRIWKEDFSNNSNNFSHLKPAPIRIDSLEGFDAPVSHSMLKSFERDGVNVKDSKQLKLARDLLMIKVPLSAFAASPSPYIIARLKDIRIVDEEARTMLSDYVNKVSSDSLPYMRVSAVADALRASKPIERFLLPGLYEFILSNVKHVDDQNLRTLMKFSDLRIPAEWYPGARLLKRNIILHVGPTNSGKTYSALKRLQESKSGVYSGPLRLLAHEVYERINKAGTPCNLLTGEERRISDGVEKWACTVEMTPLTKEFEVAVVDEIQMIGDEQRGWAWTQALLGLQAKEVHLCGEATVIPLVERICEMTGDTVTIHHYKRLTELVIEPKGFQNNFNNIRPGDCVVTFSRKNIFALRKRIESVGNLKVAVIYGNLPPETRAEQAKLFNSIDSGYDVLVASDAIGMGLNLNIRRIIFERMDKFNGKEMRPLTLSQIKQIAGRAGRFKTQYERGYVCTFNNADMRILNQALAVTNPLPLPSAGLYPTLEQMEKFAAELPEETFTGLLDKFEELSRLDGDYFLCNLSQQKETASMIQEIDLTLSDRYTLVAAPCNADNGIISASMMKFARAISSGDELSLEDSKLVFVPQEPVKSSEKLRELESMHKIIVLYLWLSFRFPSIFTSVEAAQHLKTESEIMIARSLEELNGNRKYSRVNRHAPKEMESSLNQELTYSGLDVFSGKDAGPIEVEKPVPLIDNDSRGHDVEDGRVRPRTPWHGAGGSDRARETKY